MSLLNRRDLSGCSFLDVGCGSGLFAIAASSLNASKVVGVDVNPVCVEVAKKNINPSWIGSVRPEFLIGDALKPAFMASLGQFDVVYAWGSLHHSGDLWRAVQNVAANVAESGKFVLAVYNRHWSSGFWYGVKRLYGVSPKGLKKSLEVIFFPIIWIAKAIVTKQNPLKKERGMDFYYDLVDWIGGYPYECATIQEVRERLAAMGFRLVRTLPAEVPIGNNEFVFERFR